MNLYLVEWYEDGQLYKRVSFEHVWADNDNEAKDWAAKRAKEYSTYPKVRWIYAAATTDDLPTPPGLTTYRIQQGEKL